MYTHPLKSLPPRESHNTMVPIQYVLVLVLVYASTALEYSCFAVTFRKSLQTCISVHLNLSFDIYHRERSRFGGPQGCC